MPVDNVRNDYLPKAVTTAVRSIAAQEIHTSIPGVIVDYNPETKRAEILPALRRIFNNDNPPQERAILLDVPVVQPGTGDFLVHYPIKTGDIMLVIFSERGIEEFKQTWELSDQTKGRSHSVNDAIAIPWGNKDINPAITDGVIIQSKDNKTALEIHDDRIHIRVGNSTMTFTESNIRARATNIYWN